MSFEQYTLSDYLKAFRRRAKLVVAVFGSITVVAAGIGLGLPDVYRSSAEFGVDLEGPNISQLRPVDITRYADQYVRSLQQEVLSSENRRRWLEENPDLFAERRDQATTNELVALIRDNASIALIVTDAVAPDSNREVSLVTGFNAIFEWREPESAHIVVDEMTDAFMAADHAQRTQRAAAATSFLDQEIEQKREEIAEIEAEIADFKEQHSGTLPDMRNFNMTSLERAERDLESLQNEINTAQQDLIYRRAQLEEARRTSASAERLQQLEDEYLQAISIYGPDHPTVVRIQRQVAALTGSESSSVDPEIARLEAELASMRERYSDEHPDVVNVRRRLERQREQEQSQPSDREPIEVRYLQLSAQVNATESRLQGLRERAEELRERIDEMESRLALMPQVERDFQALQRELETATLEFNELRRQSAEARQTQAFESGERGARIRLVRSANTPSEPSAPPRAAIIVLGTLFGSILAIGAAVASEALDTSVRSVKDIYNLLQTRPIASIPIVENSILRAQRRKRLVMSAIATGTVAALVVVAYSTFFSA